MKLSADEQVLVQYIRAEFLPDNAGPLLPSVVHTNWHAVAEKAQAHRLEPLLYAALKARDLLSKLPEDVAEDLRTAYFRSYVANWFAYAELSCLLDCFNREQIPAVLLKGCALGELLYSDIGLRPMVDLDVLVPEMEVPHVSALLAQRGYLPSIEPVDGFQQAFRNEQAFVRDSRLPIEVDVHWHLTAGKYYSERIPVDWFWQRTMEFTTSNRSARVFLPEAQLLQLMTHLALHHSGEGLLWTLDIALLLARYQKQMKWNEVIEAARSFGLDQILQMTLTEIDRIWRVSISCDARALLNMVKPNIATRLRSVVHSTHYAGARATWDALSTPGFRGKLVYLQLLIFPGRGYMQERYAISDARVTPLYYVGRIGKGVYMFLRAVISIAINAIRSFLPGLAE